MGRPADRAKRKVTKADRDYLKKTVKQRGERNKDRKALEKMRAAEERYTETTPATEEVF